MDVFPLSLGAPMLILDGNFAEEVNSVAVWAGSAPCRRWEIWMIPKEIRGEERINFTDFLGIFIFFLAFWDESTILRDEMLVIWDEMPVSYQI
jgi:hypothetical protein